MKKYVVLFFIVVLGTLFLSAPSVFAKEPTSTSSSSASATKAVVTSFAPLEEFRTKIYAQIVAEKNITQKEIAALEKSSKSTTVNSSVQNKPLDGTQKPIAYIKLFLLSLAGFVFSTALVFYVVCILFLFVLLRFIYRKIRNRR